MAERSSHQKKVIRNYYEQRDAIALQRKVETGQPPCSELGSWRRGPDHPNGSRRVGEIRRTGATMANMCIRTGGKGQ